MYLKHVDTGTVKIIAEWTWEIDSQKQPEMAIRLQMKPLVFYFGLTDDVLSHV
ncbi:hypothetical protein ABFY60_07585 [Lysinibacillus pakistanensis]|uniref:hypothetical protein n=1 Tax=Lysinibacillus pakistanensis TaxID=759811 RepID=UPI003D2CEB8A